MALAPRLRRRTIMDNENLDRIQHGILGDIRPDPSTWDHIGKENANIVEETDESEESMSGGSGHGSLTACWFPRCDGRCDRWSWYRGGGDAQLPSGHRGHRH